MKRSSEISRSEKGFISDHAKVSTISSALRQRLVFLMAVVAGFCLDAVSGHCQTAQLFSSPDSAVESLVAAARVKDQAALGRILAPDAKRLLSGDPVQLQAELEQFTARATEKTQLVKETDSQYNVEFGNDGWSFPIPIVKRGDQWAFDTSSGMNELLRRRIGKNELATIIVCATYAIAQWDYFLDGDWNNDGVQEFAQKFISTSGQKDGLYWATGPGESPSPLGPLIALARAEGYRRKSTASDAQPTPFHGYRFKILKAQGPSAPGGQYSYIINGRMLAGFALVAYPAVYGSSGVMTFIVNQQGRVYQKDLGPNTERVATAMTTYNPDNSWEQVDYQSLLASAE